MKRKKTKRKISPRFYVTLVVLFAAAVGIVLLAQKISEREEPGGDGAEAAPGQSTPAPVLTLPPQPTNTPAPALPSGVTIIRTEAANPSSYGFSTLLQVNGNETRSYERDPKISFGRANEYASVEGITTFGGNNYRNSFSIGTATVADRRLRKAWEKTIGGMGNWSGTGWTGQPLAIRWADEVRAVLPIGEGYRNKESFTEIIYPAMDGNIYFFDSETGGMTRDPINNGVVNKGTACLDPRGWPLLYVGQGIPTKNEKGNQQAYVRVYSLLTDELIYTFGGYDYFSRREWQAYDSSPLITDDTLIYCGENGVLYSCRLNTVFDPASGTVSISPERLVKYRYEASGYSRADKTGARWYGMESSPAAFRNWLFFTDNGGRLQCVDLNDLRLQYVTDLKEECDSTPVIDESYGDSTIYIFNGTQTSSYAPELGEGYGYTYHRKINGLTGAIVWEKRWICGTGDSSSPGGTVATPVLGKGNLDGMVFFAVSQTALSKNRGLAAATPTPGIDETPAPTEEPVFDDGSGYTLGGRIVAYDKLTGRILWTVEQSADYWSTPVIVYDENNRGYLVQCDRSGRAKLYDASNGTFLNELDLGSRIDSTPVAVDGMLVVGTRGKGGSGAAAKIMGFRVS